MIVAILSDMDICDEPESVDTIVTPCDTIGIILKLIHVHHDLRKMFITLV